MKHVESGLPVIAEPHIISNKDSVEKGLMLKRENYCNYKKLFLIKYSFTAVTISDAILLSSMASASVINVPKP